MHHLRTHPAVAFALAASLLLAPACSNGGDSGDAGDGDGSRSSGPIESIDDLEGRRVGVQSSTTGATYAEENAPDAEIVELDDAEGLAEALEAGDVDAIIQDLPANAGLAAADDGVAVVETFPTDERYGFAVAQGAVLKAELDEALANVRSSGDYDLLYEQYFPTDGAEPGE